MGHNTNLDDRISSRQGTTTREVFLVDDLPDPTTGIITLNSGVTSCRNSFSSPHEFFISDNANVLITSTDEFNITFTYSGTGTTFTTDILGQFDIRQANYFFSGSGAKIFDITSLPNDFGSMALSDVVMTMNFVNGSLGTIKDIFIAFIRDCSFRGFTEGLVVDGQQNFELSTIEFTPAFVGASGPIVTFLNKIGGAAVIGSSGYFTRAAQSCFFISPNITGPVQLTTAFNLGVGQFYQTAPTGSFSAATDASITVNPTSVVDGSPDAEFQSTASLLTNDIIFQSGSSEGTYNGIFEVLVVSAGVSYSVRDPITKIVVAFVGGGTAPTAATELTTFTDTAHGLSVDDRVLPTSTNYFTGSQVRGTPNANDFDLSVPFVADESGTWQVDLGTYTVVSDEGLSVPSFDLIGGTAFNPAIFTLNAGFGGAVQNGDVVVHTGFTEGTYNGTFTIENLVTGPPDSYEARGQFSGVVNFVSNDTTGSAKFSQTRFSVRNHGFTVGEGVQIDSQNYHLGSGIRNIGTESPSSTFDFRVPFVAATAGEVGTWNINSLDQKDPRVTAQRCLGSPDSLITGGWFTSGNTIATTGINTSTYVDLDIEGDGAFSVFSTNERIRVTDFTNGEIQYFGLTTNQLVSIPFFFSATTGGGNLNYLLKLVVDRGSGYVDFDDVVTFPLEFKGNPVQTTFIRNVILNTNDKVKWQILGNTSTTNVTFSSGNIEV